MLIHKLVEIVQNNKPLYGIIIGENNDQYIIATMKLQNSFDFIEPYEQHRFYKHNTDEFNRMTQFLDQSIRKMSFSDALDHYLNHNDISDFISEFNLSGLVSSRKWQMMVISDVVKHSNSNKIFITNLETAKIEDLVSELFN